MTSYYVEMTFAMDPNHEGLEAHLDDVAAAFADVSQVDGDVGVNLTTGRVDLCMTLTAIDRADALGKAVTATRCAIHAAGGHTPGWDGLLGKLLDDDDYSMELTPSTWIERADCAK